MEDTLLSYQDHYHMFQPVFSLDSKRPLGYEALLRSHSIRQPDRLLQLAASQHRLCELDILSIYNAISVFFGSAKFRDSSELLFINVFPSTLAEEAFASLCAKIAASFNDDVRRIVLEINESLAETVEWDRDKFARNMALLREIGFQIAFDDVGEGATTLKRIVEFAPDFIKIDRFFGMQLIANQKKQHIVKFFVDYCSDGTKCILEGLEDPEDVKLAVRLGVRLGQGFGLAKPGPLPDTPIVTFRPITPD